MRIPLVALALAFASIGAAQSRAHPYDLLHVRWEVSLHPEDGSVKGTATNRLAPKVGTKTIELDALGLKIESVTIGGKPVKFQYADPVLAITLPKPGNGKPIDVVVKYSGNPQAGLYFIPAKRAFPAKTPVVYTQGEMEDNRNWLPTYDYPDDKATSEGIIDVPKGWSVLSNGKLFQRSTKGEREKWHWKMDQPHSTYLISIVAGPYTEKIERISPVPITHWVPTGLETWGEAAFDGTAAIVDFFGKLTGFPYPYAKYSQAAVPDYMFGGMENITATTQTIGALHPPSAAPIRDETGLVAHELAHQWFGDTVTTTGWADLWINEGWASFLPAFWVREKHGLEAFDLERYGTFMGALGGHAGKPERAMVDTTYQEPIDMFDGLAYPGGASRMFMLMNKLGEEKFWATTKGYLEERKYTSFDTKAFFATWSKLSGQDLTPFMQQWFFTKGAPQLRVTLAGRDLMIRQPDSRFKLDLPVWILDGETWVKKSTKLEGTTARLPLGDLAGKPVLVDPEGWVLADIDNQVPLTTPQRFALFKHAPTFSKALIIDRLVGPLNATERVAFAKAIESPALLERYMGQLGSTEAKDLLLENLKGGQPKLALAAARTLGRLPQTPEIVSALVVAEKHSNDEVRYAAFEARLNLTNDPALADLAWTMPSYNDAFRRLALDWWANHGKGDLARQRALTAIAESYPEPTRVHAINLLGRLKDASGQQVVYQALVKVAGESSFGARNSAINALASYGDKRALPILEKLAKHPLVFIRNTAKGAVSRLK